MKIGKTKRYFFAITLFSAFSSATTSEWSKEASIVITHQRTEHAQINHETELSADLVIIRSSENGEWITHIEGSTTPKSDGVSSLLLEINGDVGSALDESDEGRIQLSELYYSHQLSSHERYSVGLLDLSGFFEQSRIASDETTQFLGASFTANPSIEFPDYSLGFVYEKELDGGLILRSAIASSNGIADNSERSYSQLLSVHENNKGLVAIASASWESEISLIRVGAWTNTSDHDDLSSENKGLKNYGSYFLAEFKEGRHDINFRFGVANPNVSRLASFTSLNYQYELQGAVFGLGFAKAFVSSKEQDKALKDSIHLETYLRFSLSPSLFITADAQYIKYSGFGELAVTQSEGITVYGIRISYWL